MIGISDIFVHIASFCDSKNVKSMLCLTRQTHTYRRYLINQFHYYFTYDQIESLSAWQHCFTRRFLIHHDEPMDYVQSLRMYTSLRLPVALHLRKLHFLIDEHKTKIKCTLNENNVPHLKSLRIGKNYSRYYACRLHKNHKIRVCNDEDKKIYVFNIHLQLQRLIIRLDETIVENDSLFSHLEHLELHDAFIDIPLPLTLRTLKLIKLKKLDTVPENVRYLKVQTNINMQSLMHDQLVIFKWMGHWSSRTAFVFPNHLQQLKLNVTFDHAQSYTLPSSLIKFESLIHDDRVTFVLPSTIQQVYVAYVDILKNQMLNMPCLHLLSLNNIERYDTWCVRDLKTFDRHVNLKCFENLNKLVLQSDNVHLKHLKSSRIEYLHLYKYVKTLSFPPTLHTLRIQYGNVKQVLKNQTLGAPFVHIQYESSHTQQVAQLFHRCSYLKLLTLGEKSFANQSF